MDWEWGANGKRYRIVSYEDTKKRKIGQGDTMMEDSSFQSNLYLSRVRARYEREYKNYQQQIKEISYLQYCRPRRYDFY